MSAQKENGPGAAATARRAGVVACGKPTRRNSAKVHRHQPTFRASYRRARLSAEGPAGRFTVTGQVAKALSALVAAGARGVTALEVNSWAYRLGAYVHSLHHQYGLAIETVREPHDGGWHGRYVLRCQVTLGPVR
jgi:hypothetical protein